MEEKKQICKSIAILLLFAALSFPTAIKIFHLCEAHNHDHIGCDVVTTHFHEAPTECDICDFHLTSFHYDFRGLQDLVLPQIPVITNVNLDSLQFHSFVVTNTQLRAPPVFS